MNYGIKKIEKRIQFIVGNALLQELQDPGLGFVTITHVNVSGDCTFAKIYVSILGTESQKEKSLKSLRKSRKYLQRILGKNLKTKKTPQITFFLDESFEKNLQFSKVLEKVVQEFEDEILPTETSSEQKLKPEEI